MQYTTEEKRHLAAADKVTQLHHIRFPRPIVAGVGRHRVQSSRPKKAVEVQCYYVFVHIVGHGYKRIGCTTDLSTACRFADMAACRFAVKTPTLLNYSLEQVQADMLLPEAKALLDEIAAQYPPTPKRVRSTAKADAEIAAFEALLAKTQVELDTLTRQMKELTENSIAFAAGVAELKTRVEQLEP